jgi:hypothetical protein
VNIATISSRFEPGELDKLMEASGRAYLDSLTDEQLVGRVSENNWFNGIPAYAKDIVTRRIRKRILDAIYSFDGVPNFTGISIKVGLSNSAIRSYICSDPALWLAYHMKRGLSPDQAVELALERDDGSPASNTALAARLRHLSAFREMAGILRCFPIDLETKVLEVTFYPEPLKAAAAELGIQITVEHASMQPFRKGESPALPAAGAAILQSVHRVATEGLTAMLEQVHTALGIGRTVILTHSVEYAPADGFVAALAAAGFEAIEAGTMAIESPSKAHLLALGVPNVDIERVQRKVAGESGVFILRTIKRTEDAAVVPALVKLSHEAEGTRIAGDAIAIDTPQGIAGVLNVKFLGEPPICAPSSSYLVEIVDDNGRQVALAAYDMDRRWPRRPESATYPGAPSADYRGIARTMAENAQMRRDLGVRPSDITRVSLKQCGAYLRQ